MRKQVEFKELETGEFFECYGDIHLKYNSRKLCKCVKLDKITGKEINGIIFRWFPFKRMGPSNFSNG